MRTMVRWGNLQIMLISPFWNFPQKKSMEIIGKFGIGLALLGAYSVTSDVNHSKITR
jgi:hypothetical protein